MKRLYRAAARALLRIEYACWMVEAYLSDCRGDFRNRALCTSSARECRLMLEWLE